ncbi:MAG: LPXTG cell wall anchor domain-containing protein [Clostridiales Family XIII bacterium]|nr:LPXTG cell wall anchor domain-containing protein [Clostridiales Family XIII bacterium]
MTLYHAKQKSVSQTRLDPRRILLCALLCAALVLAMPALPRSGGAVYAEDGASAADESSAAGTSDADGISVNDADADGIAPDGESSTGEDEIAPDGAGGTDGADGESTPAVKAAAGTSAPALTDTKTGAASDVPASDTKDSAREAAGIAALAANQKAISDPVVAPWKKTVTTTGDYLYDEYKAYGLPADHVFEDITQERVLDILSSSGDYYIVFAGPNRVASRTILAAVDAQAKANGITKIYHFDPYIDGYQLDISDPGTVFKRNNNAEGSVYALWENVFALAGTDNILDPAQGFDSDDALLIRFNKELATKIAASYKLSLGEAIGGYDADAANTAIASVFKNNNGAVVPSGVRTSYDYYSRTFNLRNADVAAAPVIQAEDQENFPLRQLTFPALFNLYNTPGEHVILYGSVWCVNTLAMIESFVDGSKAANKISYVFDTSLGSPFNVDADTGEIAVGGFNNQTWNARNSDSALRNTGYYYGEAVRPLKTFITENQSQGIANVNGTNPSQTEAAATGSQLGISFYPDGDLNGTLTSTVPWEDTDAPKNAIRLQLPFLITYNKDVTAAPVTNQWLHKNANNSAYTEFMLQVSHYRDPEGSAGALQSSWAPEITFGQAALESIELYAPIFAAGTDLINPEDDPIDPIVDNDNDGDGDGDGDDGDGDGTTPTPTTAPANATLVRSGGLVSSDGIVHYIRGSGKDFVVEIFKDFDPNARVAVNGTALPSSAYKLTAGSTIVTIFSSYLDTLAVGRYDVTVTFSDGYVERQTIAVSEDDPAVPVTTAAATTPKTGDDASPALYLIGLLAAAAVLVFVLRGRRKKERGSVS